MHGVIQFRAIEVRRKARQLKADKYDVMYEGRYRPVKHIIEIDGVITAELDYDIPATWDPEEWLDCLYWLPTND